MHWYNNGMICVAVLRKIFLRKEELL